MKKNLIIAVLLTATHAHATELSLPVGFQIETLNFAVPNARQMALTDNGTLIVATRRAGNVYAVPGALTDSDPEVITLFDDLRMPSGVAVHEGDLYIGAVSQILRVRNIERNLKPDPKAETITDALPDDAHHGWKYLKFGPDEQLYVPVGAPCNICLEDDPRYASLLRMDPDTGDTEVWAEGIRNTVGFAWHPATAKLWFSDNGRDMMGDDVPAEEINVIERRGQHFGYPFVHAGDIPDPKYGDHEAAEGRTFVAPIVRIQAHSAALGLDFYTGKQFPQRFQNALFIAEHGSWNRSKKVGYQVSVVTDRNGTLEYTPFITGWLENEKASGRPNDVLVTPDGSLLVSDDQQGVIYRVTYAEPDLAPL